MRFAARDDKAARWLEAHPVLLLFVWVGTVFAFVLVSIALLVTGDCSAP